MKFKGRLGPSYAVAERKWALYWKHLDGLGFTVKDPIYRLFAGEVFHDGEVRFRDVDLRDRSVTMMFRNVHAVDEIVSYHMERHGGRRPRIRRSDFRTSVTFRDVKMLKIRGTHGTIDEDPYYLEAELSRKGEDLSVAIAFCLGFWTGRIDIVFGSAEIEDIGDKIRRYLGDNEDVDKHITWVTEDPGHYLSHPRFGRRST